MNHDAEDTARSEDQYQEVSLRAVELLAKAQRAADDAVAEAQAYARDLERSARDQYKQILQRAQSAAQDVANAAGSAAPGGRVDGGAETVSLDAERLSYVRTYARVAHTQLKSVLAALNDELDQLAAMAESGVPMDRPGSPAAPSVSVPMPPAATEGPSSSPSSFTDFGGSYELTAPNDSAAAPSPDSASSSDSASWPPIFAATQNSISYHHGGSSWSGPHT